MSIRTNTVIVTGASAGLGFAIAKAFLDEGSNVVINSASEARLKSAEQELNSPSRVLAYAGDISDSSVSRELVRLAKEKFGSVDVLVNNAGLFSPKPFLEVDETDLDRYLDANLKGTYYSSQAAIEEMVKQGGGSIVNVGTVLTTHAIGGFPATAPSISKGGIHALTISLAAEFGKENVRVNTISPGVIRTPIHARNGIEDIDAFAGLHLLNRIGEPEDVANAAVYLAKANFVTGHILNVDGGHTAGHHLG